MRASHSLAGCLAKSGSGAALGRCLNNLARRDVWDKVLSLLANKPEGIRATDVYRARIVRYADEAHTLLAAMEADGELIGRDEQPESGGHVTRIFTKAKK